MDSRGAGTRQTFIRMGGQQHDLWRAINQNWHVPDILVQSRRNIRAVKRFFRKPLRSLRYAPRVIVTDGSGSWRMR